MQKQGKNKLMVTLITYKRGRVVTRVSGIVLMQSGATIALGHNFVGDEVIDITHIPVSDIVRREAIAPIELNEV